jgi:hypothetical protein
MRVKTIQAFFNPRIGLSVPPNVTTSNVAGLSAFSAQRPKCGLQVFLACSFHGGPRITAISLLGNMANHLNFRSVFGGGGEQEMNFPPFEHSCDMIERPKEKYGS